MWYFLCLNIARFFFLLIGGVKGLGRRNVPESGALIVAPLHVSNLDPPAVACGTNRHLRFMAKEELFGSRIFGALIRSLGAFPVKRGDGDIEAIRYAMRCLERGEAVLVFPEGHRGDGKTMGPINRGVAMLAKRTGARVLPVGVVGTHIAWPKGQKRIVRSKIRIAYGESFTYADVAKGTTEKENRDMFATELSTRIARLCSDNGLPIKTELTTAR